MSVLLSFTHRRSTTIQVLWSLHNFAGLRRARCRPRRPPPRRRPWWTVRSPWRWVPWRTWPRISRSRFVARRLGSAWCWPQSRHPCRSPGSWCTANSPSSLSVFPRLCWPARYGDKKKNKIKNNCIRSRRSSFEVKHARIRPLPWDFRSERWLGRKCCSANARHRSTGTIRSDPSISSEIVSATV